MWIKRDRWKDGLDGAKSLTAKQINSWLCEEGLLLEKTDERRSYDFSDELLGLGARYVDSSDDSGEAFQVLKYSRQAADRVFEVVKRRSAD